jgi:hypothetical protein
VFDGDAALDEPNGVEGVMQPYVKFVNLMRDHGIVHPVIVVFTRLDVLNELPIAGEAKALLQTTTHAAFGDLIKDVVFMRNYVLNDDKMPTSKVEEVKMLEQELYVPANLVRFQNYCKEWKAHNDELLTVLRQAVDEAKVHEKDARRNNQGCVVQ